MTERKAQAELSAAQESIHPAGSGKYSRPWWWLFLLLLTWVFGIQADYTFPFYSNIMMDSLLPLSPAMAEFYAQPGYYDLTRGIIRCTGLLLLPVQILGVALIPVLLTRWGVLSDLKAEKRITIGLLMVSVVIMSLFLFIRGLIMRTALYYLLFVLFVLCPSVALGIVLRYCVHRLLEEEAAMHLGLMFVLYGVYTIVVRYTWSDYTNLALTLIIPNAFFTAMLLAAAILRLHAKEMQTLPPVRHVYPQRFLRNACALIATLSLFFAVINTFAYFDGGDAVQVPNTGLFPSSYPLGFTTLFAFAFLVVTLLYHRHRWLVPPLIGLLLVCFGQGLSLFGMNNTQLAIVYNLATSIGMVPLMLIVLIAPVYYAVGARKSWPAVLGFAFVCVPYYLILLLTEESIEMVLPGNTRQGVLLFVGLCLIGAFFYLHAQLERTRTDALLKGIQEGQREKKSMKETIDGLDLTVREKEVTTLLLTGDSQKMIAAKLSVSLSTVSFHIRNVYRKLNIQSKGEMFSLFLSEESQVLREYSRMNGA